MIKKKIIGTRKVRRVKQLILVYVKSDKSSNLKMEHFTKASGCRMLGMDMVSRNGQMVLSMKVIGKIIKLMVRVYFGTFMVINMKAGGKETKLMVMENIPTVMAPLTRVTGKMICNTAKV